MIEYKNLCGVTLELPERGLVLDCFSMSLPSAETVEIDDTDLCSKFRKTFSARVIGQREFKAVIRYRPNRHLPLGEKSEPLYVNMPQVGEHRTRLVTIGHMYGMQIPSGNESRIEASVSVKIDAPMMEAPISVAVPAEVSTPTADALSVITGARFEVVYSAVRLPSIRLVTNCDFVG